MPERFEIYIVYERRYINTLPFLFFFLLQSIQSMVRRRRLSLFHYLAAPDLFRLWPFSWRRPQLCPGSGRVENVRYGRLGLALMTTADDVNERRSF